MKLSKVFCISFSLFFALIFYTVFTPQVFALTYLEDFEITTDTTWTKAEGPYVISGDVFVLGGATLTIDAGVSVKAFERTYVGVDYGGLLKINGTKDEPVIFSSVYDDYGEDILNDCNQVITPENTGSGEGRCSNDKIYDYNYYVNEWTGSGWGWGWGGFDIYGGGIDSKYLNVHSLRGEFYVYDTDFAHIDNLKFANNYADLAFKDSNAIVTNSEFTNITSAPLFVMGTGVVNLQGVKFLNNKEEITVFRGGTLNGDNIIIDGVSDGRAIDVFNGGSVTLSSTTIKNINDDDAIEVFEDGHLIMKNSTIENVNGLWNSALDIFNRPHQPLSTADLSGVSFLGGDEDGISAYGKVEIKIEKSKINNFLGAGIDISNDAKVFIDSSEISNNGVGIEGGYYYTPPTASQLEIKNSSISNNKSSGVSGWLSNNPLKAVGNYWGDASGPYNANSNATGIGNSVVEGVEFIPWLTEDPIKEKTDCCSNVVFIPGLEASRLYTNGLLSENQLWEPNRNQDVEWLYLDENGESLYEDIYTRDIIKRTNVGFGVLDSNVYKSFADNMDTLVLEKKINNWEALPYDWRMDLNKIVMEPVKLKNGETYNIIDKIIKLAESSQTKKVSIVTHSNGGLVAKILINELKKRGKENLVVQLVMVASPELGTPSAVTALLHGDDQEIAKGFLMKKSTARTLGENMMGGYNLLPQGEYFKKVASPVVEFDASVDKVNNFRSIYGDNIDSASELKDFLLAKDGRVEPANSDTDKPNVLKSNLLSLAEENHNAIDTWTPPENIKVTELAGWGSKTVRGIKYIGREDCMTGLTLCVKTTVLDREPLFTEEGDQTVVSPSATVGSSTYYLDLKMVKNNTKNNFIHKDIFEASSTLNFVKDVLLNSTSTLPEYITKVKPASEDKTLELALHSPVSIDVYDSDGKHTGLINNPNSKSDFQAFEENIPGSRYMEFGEGKYVLLDDNTAYIVKLQGLDVGTFTLESKILSSGGETLSSKQFVDIPTSPHMKAEIFISSTSTASSSDSIKIDVNGDGINDFTIIPSSNFDPILYLQILKKTVETFDASQKTKNEIYKKIDKIIKSLEKNKSKNAILKIKQFSKDFALKEKYEREQIKKAHKEEKNEKKMKLNRSESEIMLQMLNQLLNNLI